MKLQPINERIRVRAVEFNENPDSLLHIPSSAVSTHGYYEVVDLGAGMITQNGTRVEPSVKVGDLVLMLANKGTRIRIKGEEIVFVTERDIICTVEA